MLGALSSLAAATADDLTRASAEVPEAAVVGSVGLPLQGRAGDVSGAAPTSFLPESYLPGPKWVEAALETSAR